MALRLKRLSCIIIFLCTALAVCSQEVSYRVENGRFIQRLTWEADPNVLRYEVIIEHDDGSEQQRVSTTTPFVDFSLAPGRYRAVVEVYNLIDVVEYKMDALPFEVLEALQPSVTRYSPHKLNGLAARVYMALTGRNLVEGSRVFLSRDGGKTRIEPLSFESNDNGQHASVFFPPDNLSLGRWTLYVENPGGLSTTLSGIVVGDGSVNLDISALYSAAAPLRRPGGGDVEFPGSYLFDRAFTGGAFYHGAALKFVWTPVKLNSVSLGAVFEPFWSNLSSDLVVDDIPYESLNAQLVGTGVAFLFRKSFLKNMLSLNLSLGAGAMALLNVNFKQSGESVPVTPFPFTSLGTFIKFTPIRPLFIELGLSWHLSIPFNPPDLFYMRPQAGIGYSF
jgi:hypothetical protein